MGITNIGADAAQQSDADGTNGDYEAEYERYDLSGVAFGKQHPTTAVRGRAVALRDLYDENDPDRSDTAVILTDASVVTSEDALEHTVVVESDEEGDQWKVVNLEDDQTAALGPGGKIDDPDEVDDMSDLMGIDFAGNTFYGDVQQAFETNSDGEIALKRGGGAGRSIIKSLDVMGAVSAEAVTDDEGLPVLHDGGFPEHNGGYIEYHPDGRDGERPRQSRAPELRPDVEGQDVIVMIQRLAEVDPDYDGPAYWATVFANLGEDRQQELAEQYAQGADDASPEDFITTLDGDEFIRLEATDEFEPDNALVRETGYIAWQRPSVEKLNEARAEAGFDPYEPDESDQEEEAEA